MSIIDYSALVFHNGKLINENQFMENVSYNEQ